MVDHSEYGIQRPDLSQPTEETALYFRLDELVDRLYWFEKFRSNDPTNPVYDRYLYEYPVILSDESPNTVCGLLQAIDEVKSMIARQENTAVPRASLPLANIRFLPKNNTHATLIHT